MPSLSSEGGGMLVLGSVVDGVGRSADASGDCVKDFSLSNRGCQTEEVPIHLPRLGCFIRSLRMMQPVPGSVVVESFTQVAC